MSVLPAKLSAVADLSLSDCHGLKLFALEKELHKLPCCLALANLGGESEGAQTVATNSPKLSSAMGREATRNKCIATSNKCLTSSNKKLLGTSALLLVTIRL